MPLATGARLGNYEIAGPLGKGGMGEVYRAKDTKLDREVAIKVLPAAFAQHPERLARFEREAKVLAALNHPNIATIYAVEESAEGKALVMELVPGETLNGPVPLDTALKYAAQIASALDAAHEKGIIHRDLKPGNIMLTPEGVIKVLDFGLAAVAQPAAGSEEAEPLPTLTMSPTRAGMILGTAAYMSPEQASGKTVDQRTDIWAFGVVLWELLTGKRLFTGDTISHVLASVLKDQPDFRVVPVKVQRLLQACLQKEAGQRLDSIRDWRYLLSEERAATQAAAPTRKLPWVIAAALGLAALGVGFVHFRETLPVEQAQRFSIAVPENSQVHSFALSPDGRTLVIAAAVNGKRQLWLRPMDALQAQPMAFTEDAMYPFWSPDSRYIGFFSQGKLKKVAASGGLSQSLCDAPNGRGGSWSREDVIIFSPNFNEISIQQIRAEGGVPTDVTSTKGDLRHPVFLPDGRRFLYLLGRAASGQAGIYLSSLDGKENRRILADISSMVFAPSARTGLPAHILFGRENALMAVPFDDSTAQLSGEVFPVADGVARTNITYVPAAASGNGMLLYATGNPGGANQIAWVDRSGKLSGPMGAPGAVFDPALSPDEKLAAFRRLSGTGSDLWARDLSRGTETRITSDPSSNVAPLWSPTGDRIVFTSTRKGNGFNIYRKAANGSGQDELLLEDSASLYPTQWTRDGFIVYARSDPQSKLDLWVLAAKGKAAERKPTPFLRTEFDEFQGQLSPDNHWMAFTSDRSGRREVYVRPFPTGEDEQMISNTGGQMPRWNRNGTELFFEGADGKLMSVPVKATVGAKASFEAGAPTELFDAHMVLSPNYRLYEYDVTADGKRFLVNTVVDSGAASAPPLTVITNWQAGLKK